MNKLLKKMESKLWIQYGYFILLIIVICGAFEFGLLPEGVYADNPRMEYIFQTIGVLVALILVPVSLKLFGVILKRYIHSASIAVAPQRLILLYAGRLLLLFIAIFANVLSYYFTLNNIGGLCALIGLVASLFCLPGRAKLSEELNLNTDPVE